MEESDRPFLKKAFLNLHSKQKIPEAL